MNKRFCSLSFLFVAGVIAANAQWTSQDSLKLQKFLSGEKELKLNAEEIGNIRLESPSLEKPFDLSPLMDTEKPSLKFKTNLPTYFTDSIPRKRRIYLTLHPYGIFTRYDENPVTGQSYIYPMAVKFSLRNGPVRNYKVTTPLPGIGGRVLAPIGPGISYSFSAEDLLQRIFSKKGRARLHNAEHANAWKNY